MNVWTFRALSSTTGFALMAFELVATRLITPMVGSSLYTWTAVIGVILAGLSIGAYIGGRVADWRPEARMAGILFLASALATLFPLILRGVLANLILLQIPVPVSITLTSFLLFFIPSTLMGSLQPLLVRISAKDLAGLGRMYGSLSAMWSLGSIVGVFCSGFFLIPYLGTLWSLLFISGVLLLSGVFFLKKKFFLPAVISVVGLIFLSSQGMSSTAAGKHKIFEKETPNFHAMVSDMSSLTFGKTRIFFLDVDTHSIARKTLTEVGYIDIARLFGHTIPKDGHTLTIGAGAYTMPNILAANSSSSMTVVENDPDVPAIAGQFFYVDPRIKTEISDARVYLRRSTSTYDLIMGDAFSSYASVPWHLLTVEFATLAKAHLTAHGLYAVNIISAREGEKSKLFQSVDKTLKAVFPYVTRYAFGTDPAKPQNIVFIASASSLDALISAGESLSIFPNEPETFEMRRVSSPKPSETPLLTDNNAPTDTYLLPIAREMLPFSVALYQRASQ